MLYSSSRDLVVKLGLDLGLLPTKGGRAGGGRKARKMRHGNDDDMETETGGRRRRRHRRQKRMRNPDDGRAEQEPRASVAMVMRQLTTRTKGGRKMNSQCSYSIVLSF